MHHPPSSIACVHLPTAGGWARWRRSMRAQQPACRRGWRRQWPTRSAHRRWSKQKSKLLHGQTAYGRMPLTHQRRRAWAQRQRATLVSAPELQVAVAVAVAADCQPGPPPQSDLAPPAMPWTAQARAALVSSCAHMPVGSTSPLLMTCRYCLHQHALLALYLGTGLNLCPLSCVQATMAHGMGSNRSPE